MKIKARFLFILAIAALWMSPLLTLASDLDVAAIRPLPVLDNGRVKPLDTFARETVRSITGGERFGIVKDETGGVQEISSRLDPVVLILDWAARTHDWEQRSMLQVPLLELRAKLHMQPAQKWIAPQTLRKDAEFNQWVEQLVARYATAQRTQEEAEFTPLEQGAIDLQERLKLFDAVAAGHALRILPVAEHTDQWIDLGQMNAMTGDDGKVVQPILDQWDDLLEAFRSNNQVNFSAAAGKLMQSIQSIAGENYTDQNQIAREVTYNSIQPFRIVWIAYLLSLILLIASTMLRARYFYVIAIAGYIGAIVFDGFAFWMRCSITGWAPVTNMYETVIWVAMVSAVLALVLELIYRRRTIAIAGATVAVFAALVADVMPPELGNSIRNLAPVLRSNLWLSIHVLTIVSSYAAFALALVLGNIVLGQYFTGRGSKQAIAANLSYTYRSVQVGVLLVAAGTILGGLWADVSWGRFWGWDPKEVWALIVLLTYLALLHGRYAGWIKQFGLAAGAVICFTVVLMSWYGVNFVLGVGLHSYGFGVGGQGYIACFIAAQWLFVGLTFIRYRRSIAASAPDAAGVAAVAPQASFQS